MEVRVKLRVRFRFKVEVEVGFRRGWMIGLLLGLLQDPRLGLGKLCRWEAGAIIRCLLDLILRDLVIGRGRDGGNRVKDKDRDKGREVFRLDLWDMDIRILNIRILIRILIHNIHMDFLHIFKTIPTHPSKTKRLLSSLLLVHALREVFLL